MIARKLIQKLLGLWISLCEIFFKHHPSFCLGSLIYDYSHKTRSVAPQLLRLQVVQYEMLIVLAMFVGGIETDNALWDQHNWPAVPHRKPYERGAPFH